MDSVTISQSHPTRADRIILIKAQFTALNTAAGRGILDEMEATHLCAHDQRQRRRKMFNIMGAESTCQALYYIHAENNDCILLRQDNFYGGICPHCPHGSAASERRRLETEDCDYIHFSENSFPVVDTHYTALLMLASQCLVIIAGFIVASAC